MTRPHGIETLPPDALRGLAGILTDIDDTLTRDGAIEPPALQALHDLRGAGLHAIAITGRPMGWSEPFARRWPVDAIVAENGAVALFRAQAGADTSTDVLRIEYAQDEPTRTANAARLRATAAEVLRRVPGATLARDSAGRVTDIAIDHGEHEHLDGERIAQVVAIMRAAGMNASVSSIHINGWFGDHDKWSGARWIVQRLLARRLEDEVGRWIYVGDSTNDQAMFARFPLSVGVANLLRFERELHTWPAYLARGERGAGFAEVVRAVLAARAG